MGQEYNRGSLTATTKTIRNLGEFLIHAAPKRVQSQMCASGRSQWAWQNEGNSSWGQAIPRCEADAIKPSQGGCDKLPRWPHIYPTHLVSHNLDTNPSPWDMTTRCFLSFPPVNSTLRLHPRPLYLPPKTVCLHTFFVLPMWFAFGKRYLSCLVRHPEPLVLHYYYCKTPSSVLFAIGFMASQSIKNLPTVQATWAWPLGQEDPLKKETATQANAWEIPWKEEPGGLQSIGLHRVGHDVATKLLPNHIANHRTEDVPHPTRCCEFSMCVEKYKWQEAESHSTVQLSESI